MECIIHVQRFCREHTTACSRHVSARLPNRRVHRDMSGIRSAGRLCPRQGHTRRERPRQYRYVPFIRRFLTGRFGARYHPAINS